MERTIRESKGSGSREIKERICESITKFTGGIELSDDLTLAVIKIK